MNRYSNYGKTLFALVQADWLVAKRSLVDYVIDNFISLFAGIVIIAYVLPYYGLQAGFGLLMLGSCVANAAIFDIYPLVANLVSDVAGEKQISYDLLLPMPSWFAFVRIIVSSAVKSMIICLSSIPLGKLLLWNQFDLSGISITGTLGMIFACSLFAGSFGMVTASLTKNMQALHSVWQRFLFPLWIFGGQQFTWISLYTVAPWIAYISLLNPIMYTNEGFRSALLGQAVEGPHIPYFVCVPVLLIFTVLFTAWAVLRFKKRLDFV